MPRPQRKGLDYFPLDVDFLSDRKIKILKSRYGTDGVTFYIYLLCEIYKNGYYLQVDDDFYFLASADLGMSKEEVQQVLKFLLERSLLDSTLFKSDTILTSAGIQRRFQLAVKERARKTPIEVGRFWILPEKETESFIKVTHLEDNSGNMQYNSGIIGCNSRNYDIKKSKVKKSKVNIDTAEESSRKYFDDDELNRLFALYLSEREKNEKRKLSSERIRMLGEELVSLSSDDMERIQIVKKAIASGWKSFYPLRKKNQKAPGKKNGFTNFEQRTYDYDDLEKKLAAKIHGEGK